MAKSKTGKLIATPPKFKGNDEIDKLNVFPMQTPSGTAFFSFASE
jgi:hypothetical protein